MSWGKKDAPYIAGMMDTEIKTTYDVNSKLKDLFFFNSASNVQKGHEILEAMYPRTFSLHGQEYVLSLFFDDLSKLFPEIKVSCGDCISFPSSNDTKL